MGTESIGWGSVRHGRNDRLSNGGVSQVDKLLVVSGFKNNAVSQQEVRDVGRRKQLSHPHEADHQRFGSIRFRKLQMHIQELSGRNGRLHQTLWYVVRSYTMDNYLVENREIDKKNDRHKIRGNFIHYNIIIWFFLKKI